MPDELQPEHDLEPELRSRSPASRDQVNAARTLSCSVGRGRAGARRSRRSTGSPTGRAQAPLGVAAVHAVKLARGFEPLGRELANGLQHAEAAVGGASGEALLDEPVERVECRRSQTSSAASTVKPPRKTASRAKSRCSAGRGARSSRRSVLRGSAGAPVHPAGRTSGAEDASSRSSSWTGDRTRRARRASSIASGRPSRRRQMAATASGSGSTGSRARETAPRRRTRAAARPGTRALRNPKRLSTVTSRWSWDTTQPAGRAPAHLRAAARSCRAGAASASHRHARRESPRAPIAWAIAVARRSGSGTGASDAQKTPSGKSLESRSNLQREPRLAASPRPGQRHDAMPRREEGCSLGNLPHAPDQRPRLARQVRRVHERSGGKLGCRAGTGARGSGMSLSR